MKNCNLLIHLRAISQTSLPVHDVLPKSNTLSTTDPSSIPSDQNTGKAHPSYHIRNSSYGTNSTSTSLPKCRFTSPAAKNISIAEFIEKDQIQGQLATKRPLPWSWRYASKLSTMEQKQDKNPIHSLSFSRTISGPLVAS